MTVCHDLWLQSQHYISSAAKLGQTTRLRSWATWNNAHNFQYYFFSFLFADVCCRYQLCKARSARWDDFETSVSHAESTITEWSQRPRKLIRYVLGWRSYLPGPVKHWMNFNEWCRRLLCVESVVNWVSDSFIRDSTLGQYEDWMVPDEGAGC